MRPGILNIIRQEGYGVEKNFVDGTTRYTLPQASHPLYRDIWEGLIEMERELTAQMLAGVSRPVEPLIVEEEGLDGWEQVAGPTPKVETYIEGEVFSRQSSKER